MGRCDDAMHAACARVEHLSSLVTVSVTTPYNSRIVTVTVIGHADSENEHLPRVPPTPLMLASKPTRAYLIVVVWTRAY